MKTGRPIAEGEKRTKLVAFYLTENDFASLKEFAEKGGFKSTSSLLTALNEPLIHGRLSLSSGVKALSRVQRFMEASGPKFKATWKDVGEEMLNLFTPPPPTIPEDVLNISQLKQDLRALLEELENQTTNQTTKP